jgi:hypothetical protein
MIIEYNIFTREQHARLQRQQQQQLQQHHTSPISLIAVVPVTATRGLHKHYWLAGVFVSLFPSAFSLQIHVQRAGSSRPRWPFQQA